MAVSNERRQDRRQAEQLATIRLARAAAAMVWAGSGALCAGCSDQPQTLLEIASSGSFG